ncbi:MAG: hypothetical protein GEU95_01075 [Rhizobiales bacterium]|nr:hypothetical protein [Hyphomicrobiales bacterium]
MTCLTFMQRRSFAAQKAARTRAKMKKTRGELRCACGAQRQPGRHECKACHAKYVREWRKTHKMSEAARARDAARSYANVYKQRGLIAPQPCTRCGAPGTEMHHADYSRPLDVEWLCRPCHVAEHHPEATVCTSCGGPLDTNRTRCRACWAGYMRAYRKRDVARGTSEETSFAIVGQLSQGA